MGEALHTPKHASTLRYSMCSPAKYIASIGRNAPFTRTVKPDVRDENALGDPAGLQDLIEREQC